MKNKEPPVVRIFCLCFRQIYLFQPLESNVGITPSSSGITVFPRPKNLILFEEFRIPLALQRRTGKDLLPGLIFEP